MRQTLLIVIGLSISLLADFTRDSSTKIVTDSETGLQWQDNETVSMTWQNAITYCEDLTLGSHSDWRLPNHNELDSLIDETKFFPGVNYIFEFFAPSNYWSSTTYALYRYHAWIVNFNYDHTDDYSKSRSSYVRCVRAER